MRDKIQTALLDLERIVRETIPFPSLMAYDSHGLDMTIEEKEELLACPPDQATSGQLANFIEYGMTCLTANDEEVAYLLPSMAHCIVRQHSLSASDKIFIESYYSVLANLVAYLHDNPATLAPYPEAKTAFAICILSVVERDLQRLKLPYDLSQCFVATGFIISQLCCVFSVETELATCLNNHGETFRNITMTILANPGARIKELWPSDLQRAKMPASVLLKSAMIDYTSIVWRKENLKVFEAYLRKAAVTDAHHSELSKYITYLGSPQK